MITIATNYKGFLDSLEVGKEISTKSSTAIIIYIYQNNDVMLAEKNSGNGGTFSALDLFEKGAVVK